MMFFRFFLIGYLALLLIACSSTPKPSLSALEDLPYTRTHSKINKTFASDENFVVLITKKGDSLASLAKQYLGDESKAWVIADFNDVDKIVPQREIVVPLKDINPTGIYSNGYQTVPILCYHRFGKGNEKMSVSKGKFHEQMQYLKDNGFHVIAMKDIAGFVGRIESLPKKSVIITIDDGYRSTYEIAFPILSEFHFPATVFLYTDFMGARDALTWHQTKEMLKSGLIDLQPHSKTHPNMSLKKLGESDKDYWIRIKEEIDNPGMKIKRYLKNDLHTFAYPYGDTNQQIIAYLKQINYKLGVTVQAGSNPAFAYPYMLHRTMIFGTDDIQDFKKALVTFQKVDLR